ncbi:unnamed protein product [Microthlaspi erraticum]|uniref:Rad21/Rec8-like protein N-terminal domain-containing protein n=1 Tax=Microthlaspi erraticum TaxID=1685480 RepID=A0A6D2INY5_9BRAS|nr:unnamed protein product [Microthlaspi erraticum]
MFYSHQLLARQAPLGQIWMAATLHAKFNRKQLDKLDIIQICEEILNPSVPMALRLSGILMGVVVIVYERKVKLLFDDGTRFLVEINGAWRTKAVPDPTLLPKGKNHASKIAVTLPENEEADFEDGKQTRNLPKFSMRLDEPILEDNQEQEDLGQQFHQADADNITLFDFEYHGSYQTDTESYDRFERFDIEGDDETQINFSAREGAQIPTTLIPSPPRHHDIPEGGNPTSNQRQEQQEHVRDVFSEQMEEQNIPDREEHDRSQRAKRRRKTDTLKMDYEQTIMSRVLSLVPLCRHMEFMPRIQKSRDRETGISFEQHDSMMLTDGFPYRKVSWGIIPSKEEILKFAPVERKESGDVVCGEEKKKKILPSGKGAGNEEGSSLIKSEGSNDLYNLVCFSRKYFGLIVGVDDKGDGYKRLDEPIVKDNLEQEDLGQQFHQADADNITLFEYHGSYHTYDRFERFDIEGDDETHFSTREGAQIPTTLIPLPPRHHDIPEAHQGDKGSMYSIGQRLRIRVGPLKGYLCRVIALRYSDVTMTSGNVGTGSFPPFDTLRTEGAWRNHGGTGGNKQDDGKSSSLSGISGAASFNPGSGSSASREGKGEINEDDDYTCQGKRGKRSRLLQDIRLDHGTIVFVDFETVGFEPSLNVQDQLLSNILAAVQGHDKQHQKYHLAGVRGFGTTEDFRRMEDIRKKLLRLGIVLHTYHKRHMLCGDCQRDVAQAGDRVKIGELLQISLIENICKHALFLKRPKVENSSIAILSGDKFFNETVVSTLRHCGIDAFPILPEGVYRKSMTKRVRTGSVYSQASSSSSGGDQARSLSGFKGLEIPKSISKSRDLHIIWDFENSWVDQGVQVDTLKQKIEGSLKHHGDFEVKKIFAVGPDNRDSRLLEGYSDFTVIKTPNIGKKCGRCPRVIVGGYDEELLMRTTDIADSYAILLMFELALLGENRVLVVTRDGDFSPSIKYLNYMVAKTEHGSCDRLEGKLTFEWEKLQKD